MMNPQAILVIDDDQAIREMLRQTLNAAGYRATTVASGREGGHLLKHELFALVIIDIFMPGRDGLEMIVEISKRHPGLPIVAISGGGSLTPEKSLEIARFMGARAVLPKPFTSEQLLSAIKTLLP